MRIIICPDSFKGTMTAREAADAMASGVRRAYEEAQTTLLPLGDGGEGTSHAIVDSLNKNHVIKESECRSRDAIHRPIVASYFIIDGKTALIESAAAGGLTLISPDKRDILGSDTFGTGLLIADAYTQGIRDFLICMGGTATCDAGYGAFKAMKATVKEDASFTLLCDVENPLCGEKGAAAVFGPQKGALPEHVPILENLMKERAKEYEKISGVDVTNMKYAGAAGGLAGMLMSCYNARAVSGIRKVLEYVNFEEYLKDTDLVITGEGCLDRSTLSGKVPKGVLDAAKKFNIPVMAFGGRIKDRETLNDAGFELIAEATPQVHENRALNYPDYLSKSVEAQIKAYLQRNKAFSLL